QPQDGGGADGRARGRRACGHARHDRAPAAGALSRRLRRATPRARRAAYSDRGARSHFEVDARAVGVKKGKSQNGQVKSQKSESISASSLLTLIEHRLRVARVAIKLFTFDF